MSEFFSFLLTRVNSRRTLSFFADYFQSLVSGKRSFEKQKNFIMRNVPELMIVGNQGSNGEKRAIRLTSIGSLPNISEEQD